MDLPSVKHGPFHECAYCQYHVKSNGVVPSIEHHAFITQYNLIHLLCKLNLTVGSRYIYDNHTWKNWPGAW